MREDERPSGGVDEGRGKEGGEDKTIVRGTKQQPTA